MDDRRRQCVVFQKSHHRRDVIESRETVIPRRDFQRKARIAAGTKRKAVYTFAVGDGKPVRVEDVLIHEVVLAARRRAVVRAVHEVIGNAGYGSSCGSESCDVGLILGEIQKRAASQHRFQIRHRRVAIRVLLREIETRDRSLEGLRRCLWITVHEGRLRRAERNARAIILGQQDVHECGQGVHLADARILCVEACQRFRCSFRAFAGPMQIQVHRLPGRGFLAHSAQVHLLHFRRRSAKACFVRKPSAGFDEAEELRSGATAAVGGEGEVANRAIVERDRALRCTERAWIDDVWIVGRQQRVRLAGDDERGGHRERRADHASRECRCMSHEGIILSG